MPTITQAGDCFPSNGSLFGQRLCAPAVWKETLGSIQAYSWPVQMGLGWMESFVLLKRKYFQDVFIS